MSLHGVLRSSRSPRRRTSSADASNRSKRVWDGPTRLVPCLHVLLLLLTSKLLLPLSLLPM
jgi:hypothetical protein